jgi:hypothetical protein
MASSDSEQRALTREYEGPWQDGAPKAPERRVLRWSVVAHPMLHHSDVNSSSRSTLWDAVRVPAILAVALAATGSLGCGGNPLQLLDGGAAGSNGGGSAGSASSNPAGGSGGSPDGGGAGSASCTVVLAADYDQSCVLDADCVSVGQVPKCPVTDCSGCYLVAINKSEMARYMTAFSRAVVGESPGPICHCPCESGVAICRAGQCQAASCGPPRADTLAACVNAGGLCAYRANTTCNGTGPADGCAYSDEICCL